MRLGAGFGTARKRTAIVTVLRTVSAAGAFTALYGIAQYLGWDPILPAAGYHIGEGIWTIVRPPSTLGYVSYFATWLLFVIFFSIALLRHGSPNSALRWRLIAMLLTGTRAAVGPDSPAGRRRGVAPSGAGCG